VNAVPITYAQKFIYQALTHLGSRAPLLQLTACVRVSGPVGELRFAQATAALANRFPILCSRLELSHGEVLQRQVGGTPPFELIQVDSDTDQEVDRLLSARADEPLDLFQEDPFKVVVVRTRPDEAFLMLLAHHLYADAAGLQILLEEYLQLIFGDPAELDDPPRRDDDGSHLSYARQEQRMMQDGSYARRAQYWLSYLEQADPVLRLPARGPDPALASFESIPFSLDRESVLALVARASRLGVSLYPLTVAAVFHSLRQATAQDDLLLSLVLDNRRHPFERTVGDLTDFVVIRQREQNSGLSDDAVRALYREILHAMKNQVPFAYFSDQLGWLRQRYDQGLAINEVNLNYLLADRYAVPGHRPDEARQQAPGSRGLTLSDGYEVSRFHLTKRTYPDVPYHGVVLRWIVSAGHDSFSGSLLYESALIEPQLAEAITESWVSALRQNIAVSS
jgi:hypothetical protein